MVVILFLDLAKFIASFVHFVKEYIKGFCFKNPTSHTNYINEVKKDFHQDDQVIYFDVQLDV